MATIRKISPKGIDVVINGMQTILETLSWTNYEIYDRAYKNETNEAVKYERFVSGNDYQDVLTDDGFSATSFFTVSDNATYEERWNATVSIIFQLKLTDLYPLVAHRADEEAHNEVAVLLQNDPRFELTRLTKGIRNVYSELGYGANKFDDLNPYHVFKVDLSVNYDQDCCLYDCDTLESSYLLSESGAVLNTESGEKLIIE
jgi:hypothetical protein